MGWTSAVGAEDVADVDPDPDQWAGGSLCLLLAGLPRYTCYDTFKQLKQDKTNNDGWRARQGGLIVGTSTLQLD